MIFKLLFVFSIVSQVPQDLSKYKEFLKKIEKRKVEEKILRETLVYGVKKETLFIEKLSPIEKLYFLRIGDTLDTLRQFGYDIFYSEISTKWKEITSVPPYYIVSCGDEVTIYIWGKNFARSISSKIDRNGNLFIEDIGNIKVAGLTFSKAKKLIRRFILQKYSNVEVEVVLSSISDIRIFITGEVKKPGAYVLSGFSRLIDALAVAGVKKTGSLRSIKLYRGYVRKTYDLYDFLIRGKNRANPLLRDGDVIVVPPLSNVAAIKGPVAREGIYEIKNKTTLYDLVKFSGGFLFSAYKRKLVVERIVDNGYKYFEVNKKDWKKFILKDGDLVFVKENKTLPLNYVVISGYVNFPGRYPYEKGLTLFKLIKKAGGVRVGYYENYCQIYRWVDSGLYFLEAVKDFSEILEGKKDCSLKPRDSVVILGKSDFLSYKEVFVCGDIDSSGWFPYFEGMTIRDLIFLAGGLKFHFGKDYTIEVNTFENGELVTKKLSYKDISSYKLKPGDFVSINFAKKDMENAYVVISGEVKYPGWYPLNPNETLKDLVERAGGFTKYAWVNSIKVYRIDKVEYEKLKREIYQTQKALLASYDKVLKKFEIADTVGFYLEKINILKKQIDSLADILGEKRIYKIIGLGKGNWHNFVPNPGDSIVVPVKEGVVYVEGEVLNPQPVKYKEGEDINYYVNRAGGYTFLADKGRIYVIKYTGESLNKKKVKKIDPGDRIVVPRKYIRPKATIDYISTWTQIIANLITAVVLAISLAK